MSIASELLAKRRECCRSDGKPKKQYDSIEDAEEAANFANANSREKIPAKVHAYQCFSGHFHIGGVPS